MNRKIFYNSIRDSISVTESFVFGCEKLLDYIEAHPMNTNIAAINLATAYWESGKTMTPVVEAYWLSESWRRKNLRYYPWYGRGLVQTTWKANYEKVGELLGLGRQYFINHPNALLDWKFAVPALFKATEAGIYTGRSWSDYIDDIDESDEEDLREYIASRRVVNGTDRAEDIGRLALRFEKALRASGYNKGEGTVHTVHIPSPEDNPPKAVTIKLPWWKQLWNWIRS